MSDNGLTAQEESAVIAGMTDQQIIDLREDCLQDIANIDEELAPIMRRRDAVIFRLRMARGQIKKRKIWVPK